MLIAKGSPEGFPCQLFVMVSNGATDQVRIFTGFTRTACLNAASINRRYKLFRYWGNVRDRVLSIRTGGEHAKRRTNVQQRAQLLWYPQFPLSGR